MILDTTLTMTDIKNLIKSDGYVAHSIFPDENDVTVVTVFANPMAGVKIEENGYSAFFFDFSTVSYGIRWTDPSNVQRYVKYRSVSRYFQISMRNVLSEIMSFARYHCSLDQTGSTPLYLTTSALESLCDDDSLLGISCGIQENPSGLLHLLWVDPKSELGQNISADDEGDLVVMVKVYADAFALRWLNASDEGRYFLVSADTKTMNAMRLGFMDDLNGVVVNVITTEAAE